MPTGYQVTDTGGLRVGTEFDALIPPQIALEAIDFLNLKLSGSPLAAFLGRRKRRATLKGFTATYHENQHVSYRTTLRQGHASGGTVWHVATGDGVYCRPWVTLHNVTKNVRAQVVSRSTDDITVLDNVDSAGASAMEAGDIILIGPPSVEEGTDIVNTIFNDPAELTNYIQNMMEPVSNTWHARTVASHYNLRRTAFEWKVAYERFMMNVDTACMFNGKARKYASTTQTAPTAKGNLVGHTQGWWYWHQTNADTDHKFANLVMDEDMIFTVMERAFDTEFDGSDHKAFLMPIALETMLAKTLATRSRWMLPGGGSFSNQAKMKGYKGSEVVPGASFSRFESPRGVVDFYRYAKFENNRFSATTPDRFAVLDTKRIGYAPYDGMYDLMINLTQKGNTDQIDHKYYFTAFATIFTHANTSVSGTIASYATP